MKFEVKACHVHLDFMTDSPTVSFIQFIIFTKIYVPTQRDICRSCLHVIIMPFQFNANKIWCCLTLLFSSWKKQLLSRLNRSYIIYHSFKMPNTMGWVFHRNRRERNGILYEKLRKVLVLSYSHSAYEIWYNMLAQ